MSKLRLTITMSLDGYAAGPDQSEENPLGVGRDGAARARTFAAARRGARMQGEVRRARPTPARPSRRRRPANIGAHDHGPQHVRGPGPRPVARGRTVARAGGARIRPTTTPVFVLTHHPREPLEMDGGTSFHFVSSGIESALGQAKDAAGGRDIWLAGGASVINQYLAAGLVNEIDLSIAPWSFRPGRGCSTGLSAAHSSSSRSGPSTHRASHTSSTRSDDLLSRRCDPSRGSSVTVPLSADCGALRSAGSCAISTEAAKCPRSAQRGPSPVAEGCSSRHECRSIARPWAECSSPEPTRCSRGSCFAICTRQPGLVAARPARVQ